jgi:hypothetical protein
VIRGGDFRDLHRFVGCLVDAFAAYECDGSRVEQHGARLSPERRSKRAARVDPLAAFRAD